MSFLLMTILRVGVGLNDTIHTCGDSLIYHTFVDGGANPAFRPLMLSLYGHYPNFIDSSVGGQRASHADPLMDGLMSANPTGAIITMGWGINDIAGGVSPASFSTSMQSIIGKIKSRRAVPLIPTVAYAVEYADDIPAYNEVITETLWNIPGVRPGPDLYTLIFENQEYLSEDELHFTSAGYTAAVAAWAESFSWVYGG